MKKSLFFALTMIVAVILVHGASLTLIQPGGGDLWLGQENYQIKWTAVGVNGNIKLVLFRNNTKIGRIAGDLAVGSSPYLWKTGQHEGGMAVAGEGYKILISTMDNNVDDFSDSFALKIESPPVQPAPMQITVQSPNGGETWMLQSSNTIRWSVSNPPANAKVDVSLVQRGDVKGFVARNVSATANSWVWRNTGVLDNGVAVSPAVNYVIRIQQSDDATKKDDSNGPFTISAPPEQQPSPAAAFTIESPNGGENWQIGMPHRISWTKHLTGTVRVDIVLLRGGTVVGTVKSNFPNTTTKTGWSWPSAGTLENGTTVPPGTDYLIRIRRTDNHGVHDVSDRPFRLSEAQSPDFQIVDLSRNRQNKLVVDMVNTGTADYQGMLRFRINENESFVREIDHNVNLRLQGGVTPVTLDHLVNAGACGKTFEVIVNPQSPVRVPEINGTYGNSLMKRVFEELYKVMNTAYVHIGKGPVRIVSVANWTNAPIPYVSITPDLCESIVKKRPGGAGASVDYLEIKLPMKIYLKNCGSAENIRDVWLSVQRVWPNKYEFIYYREMRSAMPGNTFVVDVTPTFRLVPNQDGNPKRETITIEAGWRQGSFKQTSPSFWIYFRWTDFLPYYR